MMRLRFPVLCAALMAPFAAIAHPHVMIESATEIVFDEKGQIAALRHAWTFDEMYTAFAVQGLDKNKNGILEREELQELADTNAEGLSEFFYFTFMKQGERKVSFEPPKDQWMSYANKKMTLHLTMPLKTPFAPAGRPVSLQVYDTTYFVAFALAEGEPAKLSNAPAACKLNFDAPKVSQTYIPDDQVNSNPTIDYGREYAGKIMVTCP